jgi:hypothetical protein
VYGITRPALSGISESLIRKMKGRAVTRGPVDKDQLSVSSQKYSRSVLRLTPSVAQHLAGRLAEHRTQDVQDRVGRDETL